MLTPPCQIEKLALIVVAVIIINLAPGDQVRL
jgi:hypothetical protein